MKASKQLYDALQEISKEVESWPLWKRSIDSGWNDVSGSPGKGSEVNDQEPLLARAAKV